MFAVQRAALYPSNSSLAHDASVALRLRVYLTRGRLDRQLADAPSCALTRALALRSRQLTERGTRLELADLFRAIVEHVESSPQLVTSDVTDRVAVRTAREPVLGLAERLEGSVPVNPRGVAQAKALLTDGLSPLYNRSSERTVTQAIWQIQDNLDAFYIEHVAVTRDEPRRPVPATQRDGPLTERNSCQRW
jgi:hypothetical protein